MKLEDQVITRYQAKKLKEIGVAQKSLFYYTQNQTPDNPNLHYFGYKQENMPFNIMYGRQSDLSTNSVYVEYSAFTVGEIGLILKDFNLPFYWNVWGDWCFKVNGQPVGYGTEASARSELLIHAIESGRITIEEINNRLNS